MRLIFGYQGVVRENRIRHSGDYAGLVAIDTPDSRFVRNLVRGGAGFGISMGPGSFNNVLIENDARNNAGLDCTDATSVGQRVDRQPRRGGLPVLRPAATLTPRQVSWRIAARP